MNATASRAAVLTTIDRYQAWATVEHAIGQSRARAELELRQSTLSTVELERFQALLSADSPQGQHVQAFDRGDRPLDGIVEQYLIRIQQQHQLALAPQ